MERNKIADILYEKMNTMVKDYPDGVLKVREHVDSEGFFPVCSGLYDNGSTEKVEILVVGHDFGNMAYYDHIIDGTIQDTHETTFREINKLFSSAGIDLNKCFFTNCIVGLRNSEKMSGLYKPFNDVEFQKENTDFLLYQIEAIKPKAIITLGIPAHDMFYKLNSDIVKWQGGVMENANLGYKEKIKIGNIECMFISLVHPCHRNLNVVNRCYTENNTEYKGNDAEVKMLSNINRVSQIDINNSSFKDEPMSLNDY